MWLAPRTGVKRGASGGSTFAAAFGFTAMRASAGPGGLESPPALESITFHPAIQGATAQAERLSGLAHVAVKALQCLAYQNAFHFLDAQLFQVLSLLPLLHVKPKIGDLNLSGLAHQHRPLERMLQF